MCDSWFVMDVGCGRKPALGAASHGDSEALVTGALRNLS